MKSLYVVGLGPGTLDSIPVYNLKILKEKSPLFLRTEKHPAAKELRLQGVGYSSFDDYYEKYQTFEEVYGAIVDHLLEKVSLHRELVYAVPGHPFVAETSVQLLKERAKEENVELKIVPAMSCLDAIYGVLALDPTKGVLVEDALELTKDKLLPAAGLIVTQLYSRQVASDVKLTLMEVYPEEHPVQLIRGAGIADLEQLATIPLYELDRLDWVDHLTSLYVPPAAESRAAGSYSLERLTAIMEELLGENGCPWDKEQTHESLKKYLVEECYEVIEAIEEQDMYKLCDELGDLLLQIVFHAELARQNGYFDIYDVLKAISEKMVRRHPHVFGQVQVENSAQVLVNWDEIKKEEKREKGQALTIDVPRGLPALQRAQKIQSKAKKFGFDWPDLQGPLEKVREELQELKSSIEAKDLSGMSEELGDLLFSIVNLARFLGVEAEDALSETNNKFLQRFALMEEEAKRKGLKLSALTLVELDELWEKAKKNR